MTKVETPAVLLPERRLTTKERRLFQVILKTQSYHGKTEQMSRLIIRLCKSFGAQTVTFSDGNIYATKGKADLYPCIVAHTDTVHDLVPNEDFMVGHDASYSEWWGYHRTQRVTVKEPVTVNGKKEMVEKTYPLALGIGGDDKVGIFVALNLLRQAKVMKCAFFRDEEIGCIGSHAAEMDFFTDTTLVLQCDRRGTSEFVTKVGGTDLMSVEFKKAVAPLLEKYEFKHVNGLSTDVAALKAEGLAVSCANISCGYYKPHQSTEYINTHDMLTAQDLVQDIIATMGHKAWPHVYTPPVYTPYVSNTYTHNNYEIQVRKELTDLGFMKSAKGFYYRWTGKGPDPFAPAPIDQLALPDGTPPHVATLRKAESIYEAAIIHAITSEHPEWDEKVIRYVANKHLEEFFLQVWEDLLWECDVYDDLAKEVNGHNTDGKHKPSECYGCGGPGHLLTWDEMEGGWGCPHCSRYHIDDPTLAVT